MDIAEKVIGIIKKYFQILKKFGGKKSAADLHL